jgi:hypothetical protein
MRVEAKLGCVLILSRREVGGWVETPGSQSLCEDLSQVRAALPSIVANIEEPGFCSKSSDPEEHLWRF